jgi:hypothetical protein
LLPGYAAADDFGFDGDLDSEKSLLAELFVVVVLEVQRWLMESHEP